MTRTESTKGFTLIEIMIAVFIVGVIAAIAIPTFAKYIRNVKVTTFAADVRTLAHAANQYSMESGYWIPDTGSGVYPTELDGYFSRRKFELGSSLGGLWDFESFGLGDYASAVGVHNPDFGEEMFTLVDSRIDDGNLTTGVFQSLGSGRYYYIIEE